jgi:hypothetical protein
MKGDVMKLGIGIFLAAALFVAAVPAAADPNEPLGERINVLLGAPTTYPANQPFHVAHGWTLGSDDGDHDAIGKFSFTLDVDGQPVEADFVERSVRDDGLLARSWVFNFPAGLPAGIHALTGRWWGPCQGVVDAGYTPLGGPCTKPTEPRVATGPLTHFVTFGTNLALGKAATASSEYPGSPASQAIDGNPHLIWNSGAFAPQWIEIDLGETEQVASIDLAVAQFPDCTTDHLLYGRASASEPYTLLHRFTGFTADGQILRYTAASPLGIRFVRVETASSCSWVAWREIGVFGLAGS